MSKTKSKTKKQNTNLIWEVATVSEIKEARKKGLHKSIVTLSGKKMYELSSEHVSEFMGIVGKIIEQTILEWYKVNGESLAFETEEDEGLATIEHYLYFLEDLLPYRLAERREPKTKNQVFIGVTVGDHDLFRQLSMVRRKVAFPPIVEKYYQEISNQKEEIRAQSPVCDLCGKKGANCERSGTVAHARCLEEGGWYQCSDCEWLYPSKVPACQSKLCQSDGKIEKCTIKRLLKNL